MKTTNIEGRKKNKRNNNTALGFCNNKNIKKKYIQEGYDGTEQDKQKERRKTILIKRQKEKQKE